ncbi:hypothetical protein DXT76_13120 [Halobacillus trueperi]|uniref:Uncharacterized protein n=1 Tax=Halobacillus trueperi TaxID=156205 RepID=A0A3D8VM75_9BACI|nr:hypothetical protein [Halobacillus trueperi]RDY70387.1 hypothetical protein DXT76_13120 [Halobacillus trueperi]
MPIYYSNLEYWRILGCPGKYEKNIVIPNEDLLELLDAIHMDAKGFRSYYTAYAFSYYYLATYLYRYAVYGKSDFNFSEANLKKMLTISPSNKGKNGISFISKRNGLLDKIGFLKKESDYPIGVRFFDKAWTTEKGIHSFAYLSEINENMPEHLKLNTKNSRVNRPIHLVDIRNYESQYSNGLGEPTYLDPDNTTMISIDIFIYCMTNKELGIEAFHMYSYLKYYTEYYGGKWNCPLEDFPTKFGMKRDTIKKKLKALEEYNMIYNSHEPFVPNLREYTDQSIPANTYKVHSYSQFARDEGDKNKVQVRRVMLPEYYDEVIGFKTVEGNSGSEVSETV